MARRTEVETEAQEERMLDPNAELAAQLLRHEADEYSTSGIVELYNEHDILTAVDRVELDVPKSSANIMFMSELLLGYQDSAPDFLFKTIDQVKELPEEMKPDAIVMSGLVAGDYRALQKGKRMSLVKNLDHMNTQFRSANEVLTTLLELGIPIIYNLSDDDRRIAEDYTVENFCRLEGLASRSEGRMTTAQAINKARSHPKFAEHLDFQMSTVMPYCYRTGRTLRSSEEFLADNPELQERFGNPELQQMYQNRRSKQELAPVDEYMILYAVSKQIERGEEVDPVFAKAIDMDALQDADGSNLLIVNNFDLHTTTANAEYNDMIRHYMDFSPEPKRQNILQVQKELLGHKSANGDEPIDMIVTQNDDEYVTTSADDKSMILTTGSLLRPSKILERNGTRSTVAGDRSRRHLSQRRRIPEPTVQSIERSDDGRIISTIYDEALNEKSYSLDRTAIWEVCDVQTGSITARPDYLVKYIDYVRTRIIANQVTALIFGGDMVHGRNYPAFPAESQASGLMSMDSQANFNEKIFGNAFIDISPSELSALDRVIVQIGNHEWNSGTIKWHGYSYADYMKSLFMRVYAREFARQGLSNEEIETQIQEKVKFHNALITKTGDFVKTNSSVDRFGDYGVFMRHYHLERGGKGSGGSAPVYQADQLVKGGGDLFDGIDILMAGHWHHPQSAKFGNKLAVVGGSMAGLSGYELERAYRAKVCGAIIHIGGGLPVQIEFVTEKFLRGHEVTTGRYAKNRLKDEGYKDDRGHDPVRDGYFIPKRYAKRSALQKAIWDEMNDSSQYADQVAFL